MIKNKITKITKRVNKFKLREIDSLIARSTIETNFK